MREKNCIQVGQVKMSNEQFYQLMLDIFNAQNKPKLEVNKLHAIRKHQISTMNHPSDMLSMFNEAMANFFASDKKPDAFIGSSQAFAFIYGCFVRVKSTQINGLLAEKRDSVKLTFEEWKINLSMRTCGEVQIKSRLVEILRFVRSKKTMDRNTKNVICELILCAAQRGKVIEEKPSRRLIHDFSREEKILRHYSERLLKKAMKEYISEDQINLEMAV